MFSRCIYSLQDETNASFKQAEHIIPKAIGGMYTLPKGMVSDAVNHEFSEFEEHVIYNYPMIVLPRSIFGPSVEPLSYIHYLTFSGIIGI